MNQLKNILNKLKSIHYSRKYFKNSITKTQAERLKICQSCILNSDCVKQKKIRDKFFIFINKVINKFYKIQVTIESVCTLCGCGIMLMTSDDSTEKCKKGKWK